MRPPSRDRRKSPTRVLNGTNDRLPAGWLVVAVYVTLVGAALGLASIGGWPSLITIACLFTLAIGYLARAASWMTQATRPGHDATEEHPSSAGEERQAAPPRQ